MRKAPKRSGSRVNQHWAKDAAAALPFTLLIGYRNYAVRIVEGEQTDFPEEEFTKQVRIDYGSKAAIPERIGAFYVPEADNHNQPSFDAFVYEPQPRSGHLVIFQVTVEIEAHDIKSKGLDWLGADPVDLVVVTDGKGEQTYAHHLRTHTRSGMSTVWSSRTIFDGTCMFFACCSQRTVLHV